MSKVFTFESSLSLILKEPEKVNNLTINEKTTASMSLTWERPTGRSSMFSVTWSNGKSNKNASTNATNHTITGLTPGTKYDVSVSAVAADNSTEGEVATISGFTRKCTIHSAASLCLAHLDNFFLVGPSTLRQCSVICEKTTTDCCCCSNQAALWNGQACTTGR